MSMLSVWWDARQFSIQRADYYEFLSSSIRGARGRYTLREIFERDAHRYAGTARGRLSSIWSRVFAHSGGDLYATWSGCFPSSELAVIRVAQASGNEALMRTLSDLADVIALDQKCRHVLRTTLWSAIASLCVFVVTILATPVFTVPHLRKLFEAVPFDYLGTKTQALFRFADFIEIWSLPVMAMLVAALVFVLWSIPNLTGALRSWLDEFPIWRFYRSLNALRFMSILTVVLDRQGTTQLRAALTMLSAGATPWLKHHIDEMLDRIDHGLVGADTFDTGLLSPELHWYLQDMAEARGLVEGLMLLRERLSGRVLGQITAQAHVLRWFLLLSCVSGMLVMGLWHYAAIDELRRSLMVFYASQ